MFDYDDFIEYHLPSDIRFSKLFPNDIKKWVRCRDVVMEMLLLHYYTGWCENMANHKYHGDRTVYLFYNGLDAEILRVLNEVTGEQKTAFEGASNLGLWEFNSLDQDGGTKGMREERFQMQRGKDKI